MAIRKVKIALVEKLAPFEDEYVYDISMEGCPYFFANNILVHNSSHFSAHNLIPNFDWNPENVVNFYEDIGKKVNDNFPKLMFENFHCPDNFGKLVHASCESVGSRALYITKKRYAIMNFWKDGNFLPKPKLKAMGLDLRRSDTPEFVQNFLRDVLIDFLMGHSDDEIASKIKEFREMFRSLPAYKQGSPKRVNNIAHYRDLKMSKPKTMIPGHVRAALNFNELRNLSEDVVTPEITDGMKCVVCPLLDNFHKYTSIAYPIDMMDFLPIWFTKLPFDTQKMMESVVNKKLENLFGKVPSLWCKIEKDALHHGDSTWENFFA